MGGNVLLTSSPLTVTATLFAPQTRSITANAIEASTATSTIADGLIVAMC